MRWLGLILLIVLLVLPVSPVLADTSQDVTITASGHIENPGLEDFTVTYISDYEIQITWENLESTNLTVIKAAFGRTPTDRDDGYLVYSGNGTTTTDWVNLVVTDTPLYYAAWTMDTDGVWSSEPATGSAEGEIMIFLVLAFLALGLTATMFATRQMMMGFPCVIFWSILGGYAYTRSSATWDWQYFLFFGSMGMVIFSVMAMYGLRTKKEEAQEGDELIDESRDDLKFIDEGKEPETTGESSRRTKAVRERAERRRSQGIRRKSNYGGF